MFSSVHYTPIGHRFDNNNSKGQIEFCKAHMSKCKALSLQMLEHQVEAVGRGGSLALTVEGSVHLDTERHTPSNKQQFLTVSLYDRATILTLT